LSFRGFRFAPNALFWQRRLPDNPLFPDFLSPLLRPSICSLATTCLPSICSVAGECLPSICSLATKFGPCICTDATSLLPFAWTSRPRRGAEQAS